MSELSPNPDMDNDGMPRWVKMFGITAIILLLVFVIVHLAGGGFGGHLSH